MKCAINENATFEFMHYQQDHRAKVEIDGKKFVIFNRYAKEGDAPHIDSSKFDLRDFCQLEIREFEEFRNDWGAGNCEGGGEKVWNWYSHKLSHNRYEDNEKIEKIYKEEFFDNYKK